MKTKFKKLTSLLLAVMLIVGAITVLPFTAGAAVDADGCYYPDENVECGTNRYYFYMPKYWYTNDQVTGAGAYWWAGTDACSAVDGSGNPCPWPGYKMQADESVESLFYVDCPKDSETIIFNNYFDGGEDTTDPKYVQAVQTTDIYCSFFAEEDVWYDEPVGAFGEEDYTPYHQTTAFFDEVKGYVDSGNTEALGNFAGNFFDSEYGFAYNFDNMIYVIDPSITWENYNGKLTYCGYWYFYYGDGKYGTRLTPEAAEAAGELYSLADTATTDDPIPATPDEPLPTAPVAENTINFDVESSGWQNVKKIYCHIWRADGTGDWPIWQTRAEKCTDNGDGTWSYDLSKTGNDIKKTDGKLYCVIFSSDTGMQTYTLIMNGACIGDTAYCTGEVIENPEDSRSASIVTAWKNNTDCGAEKKISSTGNVVGKTLPEGENDVTLLAQYLVNYYADPAKLETSLLQNLFDTLKVSVSEVMASVRIKAAYSEDKDIIIARVEDALAEIEDPVIYEFGDVNLDGVVNVKDATLIQRIVVEEAGLNVTDEQKKLADINGDGTISVKDATALQIKIVNS